MPGEAAQSDEAAPRPPFIIPSPVPLTETDEDELFFKFLLLFTSGY